MRENSQTVHDLRRGNRATVLRRLYFDGPVSRQELAAGTGLSQASVSNVVGQLVEEQLVMEAGTVGSDGGRPRGLLRVNPRQSTVIGVEVAETWVRVKAFDLTLDVLAEQTLPIEPDNQDRDLVISHILTGLAKVQAADNVDPDRILGVGVGVPGLVEQGAELLVHGHTPAWHTVPLETLLRKGTDLPLHIDNGANTMGQAEMWFGAGRGAQHAVIALIGSGVGAGVIADGNPFRGARRSAGEWGHTTLALDGPSCRCGSQGCLESYTGAAAMVARHRSLYSTPEPLHDEESAFHKALTDPSPQAQALIQESARYLGAGIANLINLFNPERILLGGWAGLLLAEDNLPLIRDTARRYALHHPFDGTQIALCQLGPDAIALGAATLWVNRFLRAGGKLTPPPR
ncbi:MULTISPECIES: ROK family transcriptional regulator [unclassified Crossiella]|uniref:ROK family transcriptional regulator n=1 Tax=unclassified Crossiella TaxID=2620835 RepID=UPI001FFE3904|nr:MULTISPECIES: ROK family transcriptional regulator [unclassified Crossiella]MCK2240603.1 ROK family transcriptional regulator [Crossiella sp. S99.2]MCK2252946.1 ROK family transcriptional regulator [Crossiella sp. S99.1]